MLPTKTEIVKLFSRFGLSKIYHVIIPHTPKLPNMSRVVRSLRPYVDALFIVKGMEHGMHYHALAHFTDKTLPRFTKFHLKLKPLIIVDRTFSLEDVQNAEKAKYYESLREENNFFNLIPVDAQFTCAAISCMIKHHFLTTLNAEKAKEKKTKKQFHIGSVYSYLMKNLNENVTQTEYQEYQLINLIQKKKNRNTILLNSGIKDAIQNKIT